VSAGRGRLAGLAQRAAEHGVDPSPGLEAVEARLARVTDDHIDIVRQAGTHLTEAGGKRLRPTLVLLWGMLGRAESDDENLTDAGTVVELVHLSTLYHDDVMDEANTRRGYRSVHAQWSNTVAILTGDLLLARASELSAALGTEVTGIMARTIAALCQGQIRELQGSAAAARHGMTRTEPSRDHYDRVIEEKTASLMAASCQLGALLSGGDEATRRAAETYGWHLGKSFQIADDVLDVAGEETESGKTPGTDLREGVVTLPVLLALEGDRGPTAPADGRPLADLVAAAPDDGEAAARVLEVVSQLPAVEQAREAAREEGRRAEAALEPIRDHAPRALVRGLRALAEHAADRAT